MAVDNYWLLAFSRCEMVLIWCCMTPAAWLGKAIVHMVLFLPCLDQARWTRQMESHTVCQQSHVMCLPALIGHGLLLLAEMQGLRGGGVSPLHPYLQRCGMQRWLMIRENQEKRARRRKGQTLCNNLSSTSDIREMSFVLGAGSCVSRRSRDLTFTVG